MSLSVARNCQASNTGAPPSLPAGGRATPDGEVGTDKPLFIGAGVGGYPWQGKVDEIAKWDYALSEAELRELLRGNPAKPPAPKPPAVTPPPEQ